MTGTARIADSPIRLEWQENFGKAKFDTRITADAAPDGKARAALGLDTAPWIEGPTPLHVLYTRSGATATAEVTADLTQASLEAEPLAWSKPAGVPGEARAVVALNKRDVIALNKISLKADDLSLAGSVVLGASGQTPSRIVLDHLAWGGSRLEGVRIELASRILVDIAGGTLDAEPFLEQRKAQSGAAEEEAPRSAFRLVAPELAKLRTGKIVRLPQLRSIWRITATAGNRSTLPAACPAVKKCRCITGSIRPAVIGRCASAATTPARCCGQAASWRR